MAKDAPLTTPESQPGETAGDLRRTAADEPPLVVDLDNCLVRSDLLVEAILALIKRHPLAALCLPLWLMRGRAVMKRELANRVTLEPGLLPWQEELCAWLGEQHDRGRRLVLVTASDETLAETVAGHLGLFSHVIGSDGTHNLNRSTRRNRLLQEFGEQGFDYVGDARSDPSVASARKAVVVSRSSRPPAGSGRSANAGTVDRVIRTERRSRLPYLGALRAHHWVKNFLVFIPLLAAQRFLDLDAVGDTLLAFASFCLVASGLYIFNDLLDLNADRRHPRKRYRPIPAGDLPLLHAMAMTPLLVAGAFALAARLPAAFVTTLAVYTALTLCYSLRLKQIVLLDVIVLAGLYVIRILAGAAAIDVSVSRWLLGFSMFAFLSLALLKRYTEIVTMRAIAGKRTQVRGYLSTDAGLLISIGTASGYLAVVILALYADTATAARFYTRHELIWLVCPLFLYWISYLWLMAQRNRMPYDPVVFAVRNRTSQVLILIMAALFVLAV